MLNRSASAEGGVTCAEKCPGLALCRCAARTQTRASPARARAGSRRLRSWLLCFLEYTVCASSVSVDHCPRAAVSFQRANQLRARPTPRGLLIACPASRAQRWKALRRPQKASVQACSAHRRAATQRRPRSAPSHKSLSRRFSILRSALLMENPCSTGRQGRTMGASATRGRSDKP